MIGLSLQNVVPFHVLSSQKYWYSQIFCEFISWVLLHACDVCQLRFLVFLEIIFVVTSFITSPLN
jgi:hypothetical protein